VLWEGKSGAITRTPASSSRPLSPSASRRDLPEGLDQHGTANELAGLGRHLVTVPSPRPTKLTAAGRTQPAIVERQLDFDSPNWTFSSEMEAAPLTFRLLCADALCGKRRRQCGRGSRRATHRQGALSRNASQPRSAAGLRSLSTMQLRGEF